MKRIPVQKPALAKKPTRRAATLMAIESLRTAGREAEAEALERSLPKRKASASKSRPETRFEQAAAEYELQRRTFFRDELQEGPELDAALGRLGKALDAVVRHVSEIGSDVLRRREEAESPTAQSESEMQETAHAA